MAEKLNHHHHGHRTFPVTCSSFTFTRRIISGQGARPPPRIIYIYTYNFCTAINKPPQDYNIITENEAPPPPPRRSLYLYLGEKFLMFPPWARPPPPSLRRTTRKGSVVVVAAVAERDSRPWHDWAGVYRDDRARMRRIN